MKASKAIEAAAAGGVVYVLREMLPRLLTFAATALAIGCGSASAPGASSGPRAAAVAVAPAAPAETEPASTEVGPMPAAKTGPAALALALVVDRSGSMTGLPMQMTLDALRAAVRELEPSDWVTIIAFDTQPRSVVDVRKLGAADALDVAIDRIAPGGGTDILPALALAGQSLGSAELPERRHVILMSDGQAPSTDLEAIVGKVSAAGTTVSTVALGEQAGEDLLVRIAELGGGRYQRVEDPRLLPEVFRREVARARGR